MHALKVGATHALDPNVEGDGLVDKVRSLTTWPTDRLWAGGRNPGGRRPGSGADFVIEAAGLDKDALRGLSDSLRDRLKTGVVVLAAENDGKAQLLVSVTKDLTGRVKAGQLVKELAPIIGGGGGGRPDFAEAGGKDAGGIDRVLAKAQELVREALR